MTRHTPRRAAIHDPARLPLRPLAAILLLGLLAACAATPRSTLPVAQEAADYRAHARTYYVAPGPSGDPWGPYIDEASKRFDVPDSWIRSVIHQESGGHEFINGQFVTSVPGAMGLMQLMPPTYDDMRSQYGLGTDPYDPHDNIMAGTAYVRQMYDIYGSPGFLAAYNTGPGRLDDFLTRNRALPHETRQYVAIIGPQIAGIYPNSRSQADLMVMQRAGATQLAAAQSPSETRSVRMAWARRRDHEVGQDQPVQVAEAPAASPAAAPAYQTRWKPIVPSRPPTPVVAQAAFSRRDGEAARRASRPDSHAATTRAPVQMAAATQAPRIQTASVVATRHEPEPHARHFRLIEPAMAEPAPLLRGSGRSGVTPRDWAIQVGAFGTMGQASVAVGSARSRVHGMLPDAHAEIAGIHAGRSGARVYRARLTGLSRGDAMQACQKISRGRSECMVVAPDSRS